MGKGIAWTGATVALGLELAALALLGWGGWLAGGTTVLRVVLAIGLPVGAAVLWGLFAAPRAPHSSTARRLAVQALVFGGAAGLLAWAGSGAWGAAFAGLVVVDLLIVAVAPLPETAQPAPAP